MRKLVWRLANSGRWHCFEDYSPISICGNTGRDIRKPRCKCGEDKPTCSRCRTLSGSEKIWGIGVPPEEPMTTGYEISEVTGEPMVPVLYLDLDDTVRKGPGTTGKFVNTPQDVEVFEDVPDILQKYKEAGWRIVGVSNQGGIALGYMSMKVCEQTMLETNRQCHGVFDRISWCRHHPSAKDPEMARCWCRKPSIGQITSVCDSMGYQFGELYPPHLALVVGDMESDRQLAKNANIDFMFADEWRNGGWKKHLGGER